MAFKYKLKEAPTPNLAQQTGAKIGDVSYSKDGDTKFVVNSINKETGQITFSIGCPSKEDRDYYAKELKSFKKFRKYHDTYVVGQDENGRKFIVSVSNKKSSQLDDPQNNTTPNARFQVMKREFGEDVAKKVTLSINDGIKIHKKDCPNAIRMQSNYAYRIIQAKWIDSSQEEFKALLNIKGMDVLGLTNNLTKVISSQMNVNIQSISLSSEAGIFKGQITVVVQNNTILKKLIDNIKKVDGIDKVTRVYNN